MTAVCDAETSAATVRWTVGLDRCRHELLRRVIGAVERSLSRARGKGLLRVEGGDDIGLLWDLVLRLLMCCRLGLLLLLLLSLEIEHERIGASRVEDVDRVRAARCPRTTRRLALSHSIHGRW